MRVRLDLPELTEFPNGFPRHWLNVIFTGNRPDTFQIQAITTTYVRLVEAAFADYRQGRLLIHAVWNRDFGPLTIPIGPHNLACASFESCLTNMHRAVRCMLKIRGRPDVPQALKDLIPKKPQFTETRIADRIRDVRDAIQHLEGQVLDGTIPENTPFTLMAGRSGNAHPRGAGADAENIRPTSNRQL